MKATILFALLATAMAHRAAAQPSSDTPAANPGRPTVATPATLTPLRHFQFETGMQLARNSPGVESRLGANNVTKFTLFKRLQLLGLFEPAVRSQIGDAIASTTGGISAGAQFVIFQRGSGSPTAAVSYFKSLYGGNAPDLDVGSSNQSLIFLVSGDVTGFHADFNVFVNEQKYDDTRYMQNGVTICVSHPVGPFTVSGELWTFTQPLIGKRTIGNLWAVSYPARPNLVFDVAVNRGLTDTSTRWQLLAGFTYLLPHSIR